MATHVVQARSLYRGFLRELPSRTPNSLANPSPIQQHIRTDFATPSSTSTIPSSSVTSSSSSSRSGSSRSLQHQAQKSATRRLEEAQQYLHYLRAQREYITLLERYNPGMNMAEKEMVRLTARRVGMDLPVEMQQQQGGGKE